MPFSAQLFSRFVPAAYFMEISRGIVLKGADLGALWMNVGVLAAYTLVIFAFAVWRLKQKVA
jgi:ABC-2 type transport system permease protein